MEKAYYARFMTNLGEMYIASSNRGVCKLKLEGEATKDFFDWLGMHFEEIKEDVEKNQEAIGQIVAYARGNLREFDVKLHCIGTPFQKKVWQALCSVPYGQVASYKDIAIKVGTPKGFRAVGMANNRNNIPIIVPCHRIIGHDGGLVGYGGGLDMKVKLLQLEGIGINGGKVATR
ncbi:methylated-DNA--[protein]-cysteine S-methyltransferase [Thermotalea metallivorans]|uniref:Methylated-DNA--protein-cysteine methyltransferase n=1 Tax=Thermotalea metallivorans TaxID=520762 RepID=A0A140LEF4_9FIRM|nr:methylated-DNA--[protein]-cysteine S-methyltransferase [Thermotalea metallivorans]KXG78929.1 Methylated-DNA--protein-cysteine methyltransferase, constitutive [Thermotalea metallivorans]